MKKVKLLKDYGDRKKGDVAEVDNQRADAWLKAKVAKEVK